jgi:hypothetical protein
MQLPPSEVELAKQREELRQKTDTIDLVKSAIMPPLRGGTVYGIYDWASNASEPTDDNFIEQLNRHYEVFDKRLAKMGLDIYQRRDALAGAKNPQHLEELIRYQQVRATQENIYHNALSPGEQVAGNVAAIILDEAAIAAATMGVTSTVANASIGRAALSAGTAAETAAAVAGRAPGIVGAAGKIGSLLFTTLTLEGKLRKMEMLINAAAAANNVNKINQIREAALTAKQMGVLAAVGSNATAVVLKNAIQEDYTVWDGLFDLTIGSLADIFVLNKRISKAMHTSTLNQKREILEATEVAKNANDTYKQTEAFREASAVDAANKAKNEAKASRQDVENLKAQVDAAKAATDAKVAEQAATDVKTKGKKTSTKTEAADTVNDTTKQQTGFNEFAKEEEKRNKKAKEEYDAAMGDDLNTKLGAAKKQRAVKGITIEKQIENLEKTIARTKNAAKKAKLIETRRLYDLERKLGLIAGDKAKYGAVVAGQAKKASTIVEKIQKNINELVDDAIDIPRLKEDLLAFEKEYGGHLQIRVDKKSGEVFIDFVESKTKKTQKVGKSNLPGAVVLALAGSTTASMAASDEDGGFPLGQIATALAVAAIGVGTVRAWKRGRPLNEALSATAKNIGKIYDKSVERANKRDAGTINKLAEAAKHIWETAMLPYRYVQEHGSPETIKIVEKLSPAANKTSGSGKAAITLQSVVMDLRNGFTDFIATFGTGEFSQWCKDVGIGNWTKSNQIDEFGKRMGEFAFGLTEKAEKVNPFVKKTVGEIQDKMKYLFELAQTLGVEGFPKAITVESYIPHYFTYSKLRNALTKSLTKVPDTLGKFRQLKRVVNFKAAMVDMLEKNNYHNFFDSLSEEQLANADALGELYMKNIDEYVDNFIEKVYYSNSEGNLAAVGDSVSGRAKVRWTLDYQAMHNMQVSNDTVLKLDDILETDLNVVFERYVNEMAGHIGTKVTYNKTPQQLKNAIANEPNKEVRDVLLRMVNEVLGHKNFEVQGFADRAMMMLSDASKGTGLVFTTLSNMSEVVSALYLKYKTSTTSEEVRAFANQYTGLAVHFFNSGVGKFVKQLYSPRSANKHLNENFENADILDYLRSGVNDVLAFTKWFGLANLSDFQAMTVMHAQIDSLIRYSHGLPNKLSETDISHIGLNKEEIDLMKKYYRVEHNVAIGPDWDELKKTKAGFKDFQKLNTVFQRAASMYTPIPDVGITPDWMRASAFGQFAGNLLGSLYLSAHQIGSPMTKKILAGEPSGYVQAGLYFSTYMAIIMAKQKLMGKEVDEEKAFYQALLSMPQGAALSGAITAGGGGTSWGIVNNTVNKVGDLYDFFSKDQNQ